jgi:hypothetical protein
VALRSRTRFVAGFLGEFLETQFVSGQLTADEYHSRKRKLETDARKLSGHLFAKTSSVDDPDLGSLTLRMLREPDLREFPFIQVVPRTTNRRRIRCFVGHRFTVNIERSLRYNLRHLLEPYRIDLEWSGYDLSAHDVFEDIIGRIRTAEMCLFDNLGTLNRPNVYVEVGIAYALERPLIVCEYVGKRRPQAVPDTASVPSDLAGILTVRYHTYEELCRQLYFKLPLFLSRHQLGG